MGRRAESVGAVLVTLVALAAAANVAAAPRPPVFRTAAEVVGLSVSVTDDRNRYVGDLREGDFTLYEDGIPQRLFLFERGEVPISLVLMIDSSSSMAERLDAAQSAAIRLVRALGRKDRAQVVEFGERTRLLQDFTSEPQDLEAAIRSIRASGQTALRNAVYDVLERIARLRRAGEARRWAVVLLSDGEDTSSLVSEDDVLDLARKGDPAIYTIGLLPRRAPREGRFILARASHFLASLARATAGEAYLPHAITELDGIYDQIAGALRTRYVLGYVSTNPQRDGSWRRIQVRIPGRPDLAPRHRPGSIGIAEVPLDHVRVAARVACDFFEEIAASRDERDVRTDAHELASQSMPLAAPVTTACTVVMA